MSELHKKIKEVIIEELNLDITLEDIADDTILFGEDGLGLDSVDALQVAVAAEKKFGLKISDTEVAKGIFKNVTTIAEAIKSQS